MNSRCHAVDATSGLGVATSFAGVNARGCPKFFLDHFDHLGGAENVSLAQPLAV